MRVFDPLAAVATRSLAAGMSIFTLADSGARPVIARAFRSFPRAESAAAAGTAPSTSRADGGKNTLAGALEPWDAGRRSLLVRMELCSPWRAVRCVVDDPDLGSGRRGRCLRPER